MKTSNHQPSADQIRTTLIPTGPYAGLTYEDRFLGCVTVVNGCCWEWRGKRFPNGYGVFLFRCKELLTHRVAYLLANGDIPDGAVVMHSCDNRGCCNPAHLSVNTQAANVADMLAKGRNKPPRGEKCGNAKLSEEDVRAMRRLVADGATHKTAATIYSVSEKQVSLIVRKKQWAHI